jgi:NAD(P)H-flavin reductase
MIGCVTYMLGAEPVRLIRKDTMVTQGKNILGVRTLTFKSENTFEARIDLGDVLKVVIPGYKPKSYSINAICKNQFDITVKLYPGGRASGYLDRMKINDSIRVFVRRPYIRSKGQFSHVGAIAFGVGITEALPVAEAELRRSNYVTLLWACRHSSDYFWDSRINQLKKTYPKRFKMVRILSREKRSDGTLYGRIDVSVLRDVFSVDDIPKSKIRFLRVGTKKMMRHADQCLRKLGFVTPGKHLLLQRRVLCSRMFNSNPERE